MILRDFQENHDFQPKHKSDFSMICEPFLKIPDVLESERVPGVRIDRRGQEHVRNVSSDVLATF